MESYHGYALCNFKQGKVQKAIDALDKVIVIMEEQSAEQAAEQIRKDWDDYDTDEDREAA